MFDVNYHFVFSQITVNDITLSFSHLRQTVAGASVLGGMP